jgi:hypothetical protein
MEREVVGKEASQIGKLGFPNWEVGLPKPEDRLPKPEDGEGVCGTGGGAENFFPARVSFSDTASPGGPSKSFPPPRSTERPLTLSSLRGGTVSKKETVAQTNPTGEPEAGMYCEENRMATDEKTLITRLIREIGRDGETGMDKKGALWRSFIRGSTDAGNDPATAEAVRDALNEMRMKRQTGVVIRSAFGWLWKHSRYFAGLKGWTYDMEFHKWKQVPKFNLFEHENAARKCRAR